MAITYSAQPEDLKIYPATPVPNELTGIRIAQLEQKLAEQAALLMKWGALADEIEPVIVQAGVDRGDSNAAHDLITAAMDAAGIDKTDLYNAPMALVNRVQLAAERIAQLEQELERLKADNMADNVAAAKEIEQLRTANAEAHELIDMQTNGLLNLSQNFSRKISAVRAWAAEANLTAVQADELRGILEGK